MRTGTFEAFLAHPSQPRSGRCHFWRRACIRVRERSVLSFFIVKVAAFLRPLWDGCGRPESRGGQEREPSAPTGVVSKGAEGVRRRLWVALARRAAATRSRPGRAATGECKDQRGLGLCWASCFGGQWKKFAGIPERLRGGWGKRQLLTPEFPEAREVGAPRFVKSTFDEMYLPVSTPSPRDTEPLHVAEGILLRISRCFCPVSPRQVTVRPPHTSSTSPPGNNITWKLFPRKKTPTEHSSRAFQGGPALNTFAPSPAS